MKRCTVSPTMVGKGFATFAQPHRPSLISLRLIPTSLSWLLCVNPLYNRHCAFIPYIDRNFSSYNLTLPIEARIALNETKKTSTGHRDSNLCVTSDPGRKRMTTREKNPLSHQESSCCVKAVEQPERKCPGHP